MPWGVAAAAVSAYGAYSASENNKDASKSAQGAYDKAYYNNLENLQPYLNQGQSAINKLTQLDNGDYSGFMEAPDYQFTLDQSIKGLDRSAAARGSLYSGGQQADLTRLASGLASQQLGNYRNNLVQLAGMGQSAGSALAGVSNSYANSSANNAYQSAANSNALTGVLTGIGSNLLTNINWGSGGGGKSAYGEQITAINQDSNRRLMARSGL